MMTLSRTLRPLLTLALGASLVCPAIAQESDLGPTLKKIADSGTIYLGFREAAVPFSYVTVADKEKPQGYSWDVCGRIVKAIEGKIGKEIKVVPVVATANARLMMVKVGMADIECGATTHSLGREKLASFSNTIFVAEVGVLVRASSGLKSANDLAGKRVVTTGGTTADRLVKQTALQRNISIKQLVEPSHVQAMALLERGEADAYVADDAILLGQRANSTTPDQYVFLPNVVSSVEPYGLVLPKDDLAFKKLVDDALVTMMKSGEMATIYDKWFMQPIPPINQVLNHPISDLNKTVFANPNDRPVN